MNGPHQGQPVLAAGAPLSKAAAAMVMVHGRGANAPDILGLAAEFGRPDWAYLAPQAAQSSWYPDRFLAATRQNEPWLSSALAAVGAAVQNAGLPPERLVLLGFSQGACLALEYAARNGQRYGGLAGLSGGLIGADGEPRQDAGDLTGTPVFLGCSDADFHIPRARVVETGRLLTERGAQVTVRLYPNMGHTINGDEIETVKEMMAAVAGRA